MFDCPVQAAAMIAPGAGVQVVIIHLHNLVKTLVLDCFKRNSAVLTSKST
jgi:hypothetical protein